MGVGGESIGMWFLMVVMVYISVSSVTASVFDGAPKIKSQIKIKIKSGSLRIVVTVCCDSLKSCVDTYGYRSSSQLPQGIGVSRVG